MKLTLLVLLLLLIPRDTHQGCSTVGCLDVAMETYRNARIPSAYAVAYQFPQASHCQPTIKDQYHYMNKCLDGCNVQVGLSSNPQYNINPTYSWHYNDNFWNVDWYDQSTTTQYPQPGYYPNEQCTTENWLVWDGSVRHIPEGSARDYPAGFCNRRLTSRDNSDVHGFWDYGYRNANFQWTGQYNYDDDVRSENECNRCAVGYVAPLGSWSGKVGGYGTYLVTYSDWPDDLNCLPAPAGYCAPYKNNIHSYRYSCATVAVNHISDLYKNNGDEAYGLFDTTVSNGARGWQYNFYLDGCESGFCGSITQCSAYMYESCPSGSTLHNSYDSLWSSHSTYTSLGRSHSPHHDGPYGGRCKCPAGEYLANCAGWNRGHCKMCGSCPLGTFEVMPCNDWSEELSVDQIWTARNPNGPPICKDCWAFSNRCEIGQFLQGCSGTSSGTCVWCSQHACQANHYRVGCGSTCGHTPKTTPWRTWDTTSNDFFYAWGPADNTIPTYSDITPQYLIKGESSGCTSSEGECVACMGCPTNQERVGCSGTSAGSCSACAAGKYKPDAGNGPCIPCVTCYANTYNSACGSCTSCGSNTHKIGTTYATSCTACEECPHGQYIDGCGSLDSSGNSLAGGPGRCLTCPSNHYKNWHGYGSCIQCMPCTAPQYETQACNTNGNNRMCGFCNTVNCGTGRQLVGCGYGNAGSCQDCPFDHFNNGNSHSGCSPCSTCDDGKYQTGFCNAGGQDRQCSTCSPECGAGFWESTPCTTSTNRVCTDCTLQYCPAGSSLVGCEGLSKGWCVADAGFTGNPVEGFSLAAYNLNSCHIPGNCGGITQCPPSFFKSSPGSDPCVPCLGCGENQYKDGCDPVTGSICLSCPTGYTSPPNSVGSSSCQTCAVSTANSPTSCANICQAPPGYVIASDGNSLTRCEEGTYNSGTTGVTCTSCPAGKNSPEGSDSIDDCVCDKGRYLLSGSCEECSEGTYKEEMGNNFCVDCPESSTTDITGADSITDCLCLAGFEANHLGDCVACPGTSDKFIVSDDACIQCGDHQTLNSNLPHQQSSCECNAGYTGTYLSCEACPIASFKSTKGSASCVSCTDHATTPTDASTSITACACEGPMWVPSSTGPDEVGGTCQAACGPGETAHNNVCIPCSEGTYKSVQGLEACTECTDPRNSSATGATSADDCSCRAGEIALGGNYVEIVSLGDLADTSTVDCDSTCTILMQPNQRLQSVELKGSGHQHITIETDNLKVFVCTNDCEKFTGTPTPLPPVRGNTQITVTSGLITVSMYNGQNAVFSASAPWMDTGAPRSLITELNLQPGDWLLDSSSIHFTSDQCVECPPGLICRPFITLQ